MRPIPITNVFLVTADSGEKKPLFLSHLNLTAEMQLCLLSFFQNSEIIEGGGVSKKLALVGSLQQKFIKVKIMYEIMESAGRRNEVVV